MRGLRQDGRAQMRLGNRAVAVSSPSGTRGVFEIEGVGAINIATGPGEFRSQRRDIFHRRLASGSGVRVWGVSLGSDGGRPTVASSGGEMAAEAEDAVEEERDWIIASPECDRPPIRLC